MFRLALIGVATVGLLTTANAPAFSAGKQRSTYTWLTHLDRTAKVNLKMKQQSLYSKKEAAEVGRPNQNMRTAKPGTSNFQNVGIFKVSRGSSK